MPIRTALIFFGLFAVCVVIAAVAWAIGAELHLVLVGRGSARPKSIHDPLCALAALLTCPIVYRYSKTGALILLTFLAVFLLLGCLVRGDLLNWQATGMQVLLTAAMIVEVIYGWRIARHYMEE